METNRPHEKPRPTEKRTLLLFRLWPIKCPAAVAGSSFGRRGRSFPSSDVRRVYRSTNTITRYTSLVRAMFTVRHVYQTKGNHQISNFIRSLRAPFRVVIVFELRAPYYNRYYYAVGKYLISRSNPSTFRRTGLFKYNTIINKKSLPRQLEKFLLKSFSDLGYLSPPGTSLVTRESRSYINVSPRIPAVYNKLENDFRSSIVFLV